MSQFIFHCGFPKTGSTSLQISFDKSDVNYLGFNPRPQNGNFYKTQELSFFLEQVARFGSEKSFNNNKKNIEEFLKKEVNSNKKNTVLSNENIVGRITPFDLPNDIKIRRALSVLPDNSVILLGTRKLENLLYSYYKLLLSNGYGEDSNYFFQEIIALESSFGLIDSFRISNIMEDIKKYRPDIIVKLFDITDEKSVQSVFLEWDICITKSVENESFKLSNLNYHINLNNSFYAGKRFLDWFEIHRVFPEASFDDDSKYRLSRSRHLHNKASQLKFLENETEYKEIFEENLPKFISEISKENDSYLK